MPFKMEAFTLLRNCLTQCKITHLMRTIPPCQIEQFLRDYDLTVREAFENLIDFKLEDRWWSLARLQSKHGGMGMRTGITTAGAQHFSSLAKCSKDITKFVPDWDGCAIAVETTGCWLEQKLNTIEFNEEFQKIKDGNKVDSELIISQKCELEEAKTIRSLMSSEELLHIRSNCGPGGAWVRVTPLSWKGWEMKPKQ